MNQRLVGALVTMMIMAHDSGTVGQMVSEEEGVDHPEFGYKVETSSEGVIGIKVTVVEDKKNLVAFLSGSGETEMIQGSEEEFVKACESYTLVW